MFLFLLLGSSWTIWVGLARWGDGLSRRYNVDGVPLLVRRRVLRLPNRVLRVDHRSVGTRQRLSNVLRRILIDISDGVALARESLYWGVLQRRICLWVGGYWIGTSLR